jgi:hypothetical protein
MRKAALNLMAHNNANHLKFGRKLALHPNLLNNNINFLPGIIVFAPMAKMRRYGALRAG